MAKRQRTKPDKDGPPNSKVVAETTKRTKPLSRKTGQPDPLDLAAPLVATIEIQDVLLADSRVSCRHIQGDSIGKAYLKLRISETTFSVTRRDEGLGKFWIKVVFSLLALKREGGDPGVDLIFEIEASFRITYKTSDSQHLTEPILDAFAKTNGVFNAWPFWREYAQSVTARMGLPPVPIPAFRL